MALSRLFYSVWMPDFLMQVGLDRQDVLALHMQVMRLTPREMEAFACYGQCMKSTAIAAQMGISKRTIDIHRESIKKKLQVTTAGIVRAWMIWCLLGRKVSDASSDSASVRLQPTEPVEAGDQDAG